MARQTKFAVLSEAVKEERRLRGILATEKFDTLPDDIQNSLRLLHAKADQKVCELVYLEGEE